MSASARPDAVILGDWGTSNLRLWLQREGQIVDRASGPGIGGLDRPPAEVLADLTAAWRKAQPIREIVLCGMAGARNGLLEAPYADCPASAETWAGRAKHSAFHGVPLRICAGVATDPATGRDDVMRGEETQVFGAVAREPGLARGRHTLVLPGTHSKWVTLEDGRITDLRTFLTGELFALLCRSSLLAAGGEDNSDDEAEGFAEGAEEAASAPGLTGSLFHARAAQLRRGRTAGWARGYLSGLLLASEVAQTGTPDDPVMIGAPALCERYARLMGPGARRLDDESCTLAGLEMILAYD